MCALIRRDSERKYLRTITTIEGNLSARLSDGSLRLLRVGWLLSQPDDYVLQRQQDLPAGALRG